MRHGNIGGDVDKAGNITSLSSSCTFTSSTFPYTTSSSLSYTSTATSFTLSSSIFSSSSSSLYRPLLHSVLNLIFLLTSILPVISLHRLHLHLLPPPLIHPRCVVLLNFNVYANVDVGHNEAHVNDERPHQCRLLHTRMYTKEKRKKGRTSPDLTSSSVVRINTIPPPHHTSLLPKAVVRVLKHWGLFIKLSGL